MRWLDTKFRLRGEQTPGDEVIVVAIDDRTLAELGGSARTMIHTVPARMVDAVAAAGARVIGFDVLYSEADISDINNDRLFAEAIERAGNVVMGVYLDLEATTGERGERDELTPELQALVIEKQGDFNGSMQHFT